jgi:rod shape-determining protein MreD
MKISIIVFLISFILDGLVSNFIIPYYNDSSLFFPLFSVVILSLIYPYFNNDDKSYLRTLLAFGLLYDIVYTNTLFLNMILFFLIGISIKLVYLIFPVNILSVTITSVITISLYHLLNFIILNIINYNNYEIKDLGYIITHSLILNVIYAIITYFILNIISRKFKIKRID